MSDTPNKRTEFNKRAEKIVSLDEFMERQMNFVFQELSGAEQALYFLVEQPSAGIKAIASRTAKIPGNVKKLWDEGKKQYEYVGDLVRDGRMSKGDFLKRVITIRKRKKDVEEAVKKTGNLRDAFAQVKQGFVDRGFYVDAETNQIYVSVEILTKSIEETRKGLVARAMREKLADGLERSLQQCVDYSHKLKSGQIKPY